MVMGILGAFGLLVVAAVLYSTTKSAAAGSMPRNAAVGIRTAATKSSDAAWVAGHRAALPPARVISAVTAVLALCLAAAGSFSTAEDPTVLVYVLFAAGYAFVLLGAWRIVTVANHAASAHKDR